MKKKASFQVNEISKGKAIHNSNFGGSSPRFSDAFEIPEGADIRDGDIVEFTYEDKLESRMQGYHTEYVGVSILNIVR